MVSHCRPVRLFPYIGAAYTGRIYMKFDIETFIKMGQGIPNLIKADQKYG
jgi:hypothetical protein